MSMRHRHHIPQTYNVGGQTYNVVNVERCEDNAIGMHFSGETRIEIADKYGKDYTQSDTSKVNTFYHELVHSILTTMGENELNENEKFVCTFSSFLTEAMTTAEFKE